MQADSSSSAVWSLRDSTTPLSIGFLLYRDINQIDLTAPYEVFARMPNSTMHIISKDTKPVREERGLLLTPTSSISASPPLDVLVVPGGRGQQGVMEDEEVLSFIRRQPLVFSVCTGSLLCGAAGLLMGRRATSHWAAVHLLPYFGATHSQTRVAIDGPVISAAGVTAGIDGALHIIALLRGPQVAGEVELALEYNPEPPLGCGSPHLAPPTILHPTRAKYSRLAEEREITARRIAAKLGIAVPAVAPPAQPT